MTWLPLLLLALLALAPLAWTILRPPTVRGRRDADIALYRAQLAELERERESGRLSEEGHRGATIEVQRRLLAADAQRDGDRAGGKLPATALLLLPMITALGVGLYLLHGTPGMPSAPYTLRTEIAARDDQILAMLRSRLDNLDPHSEAARQGWVLLGSAERERGRPEKAVQAWERALGIRFDASLAGEIAETEISRGNATRAAAFIERALDVAPTDPRLRFLAGLAEVAAGRPANARALWQALIADAPVDAPWRGAVERQLNALP